MNINNTAMTEILNNAPTQGETLRAVGPSDIQGRLIEVGDTIVYSGRGSTKSYIRLGTVEAVIPKDIGFRLKVARQGVNGVMPGIAYVKPAKSTVAIVAKPATKQGEE